MSMLASVNGTGFLSKTLNSDITLTSSFAFVSASCVAGATCERTGSATAIKTRAQGPAPKRGERERTRGFMEHGVAKRRLARAGGLGTHAIFLGAVQGYRGRARP